MRILTIITLSLFLTVGAFAKQKGAPPMASGAPGDRTCLSSKCHAGAELNAGDAQIVIEGLPKVYTANEIYTITLKIEQSGPRVWGFQATVADSAGAAVGSLKPDSDSMTQLLNDENYRSRTNRQYVTHTEKGSHGPKKGVSPSWKIQWQAPSEASAVSTFYFAFNAANGNKKKTGDYIYTRSIEVQPAIQ